jgi:hypothetical protein
VTKLERYLAANPAMTARDFEGKGPTPFNPFDKCRESPDGWRTLDRRLVREAATTTPARFLTRRYRIAAARDPALIWDPASLLYRLRNEGAPAPREASDGGRLTGGACET